MFPSNPSFFLLNFVNLPFVTFNRIEKISMRIVVQRVSHASVTIEGQCKSSIGKEDADTQSALKNPTDRKI